MLKTLTLIRHTKPDIATGICYGQSDIDVTESFIAEAAAVSGWLSPPDLIITSPLLRTSKLAEYLATQHRCEVHSHPGLMEMNFGDWEGRAWSDIARRELKAWSNDVLHYKPPNGESAQQMMQRVQQILLELVQIPQQHIAFVAHGGSMRAILSQLAAIPLQYTLSWQIEYGAVISLRQII